jgi:hypothetical protein
MTLVYPLRHIFITQKWGVNPQVYSRFGLKGHNGVDYRLFDENGNRATTAILYAPHDGKVIEARNDPNGYGLYLKIENSTQGSILAHLKSFSVKTGDTVKTGQQIGVCNNSGFSTGAHLHWGYYPIPRDRGDGYSGTINQENIFIQKLKDWEDSMSDQTDVKELQKRIQYLEDEREKDRERIESCRADRTSLETEVGQLKQQIKTLKEEFGVEREGLKEEAQQQKDVHKEALRWLAETLGTTQDFAKIRAEIVRCIEFEDLADKRGKEVAQLNLQLAEEKEDNKELKDLVDDLRRQAREAKGLGDATTADLLQELINRLLNIIGGKS